MSRRRDRVAPAPPPGEAPAGRFKTTVRAVQKHGEEHVVFHLQTPSAAGLPAGRDGRGTYWATPLGISARPLRSEEAVHYSLEVTLSFRPGHQRLHSDLQQPFSEKVTWVQIGEKFDRFRDKVREQYPYFTQHPHLRMRAAPENKCYYELVLPPYTGLFTDDEHFWTALRFKTAPVEHHRYGASDASGRHGVANKSPGEMIHPTEEITLTERPDILYRGKSGGAPPARKKLRLEVEFYVDWLPQTLAAKKKLDSGTAAKAFAHLLRAGLAVLSLDPDGVVEVDGDSQPGSLVVTSKRYGAAPAQLAVVSVRLSPSIRDFFVLGEDVLNFPSNDPQVYVLGGREAAADDPLAGRYPLHLVAEGRERAHHFVHGRGWTTVLGLLSTPSKFAGANDWVELRQGTNELRLLLLDRWCKPVVSYAPTEFVLYLELVARLF